MTTALPVFPDTLQALHDVLIESPLADGDALVYSVAEGKFIVTSDFLTVGEATDLFSPPFADDDAHIFNLASPTKQARFDASGITAGQTRVLGLPDRNGTLATLEGDQTFAGNNIFQRISINGTAISATSYVSGLISLTGTSVGTIFGITLSSTGTGQLNGTFVGASLSAHTTGTRANATGISISANGTGNGGTTTTLTGIQGSTSNFTGHITTTTVAGNFIATNNAGTATSVIGLRGQIQFLGASNTSRASVFNGQFLIAQAAASITTLVGLDLSSWGANSGTITDSYGIYLDTTIDVGATRYAFYSLSTSPSLFTGRVNFGGVTSSFPALKNSSAVLQVRLANDSAYAALDALEYRVNGTKVVSSQQAHVNDPAGGTTVDAEARTVIASILDLLEAHGLMAA